MRRMPPPGITPVVKVLTLRVLKQTMAEKEQVEKLRSQLESGERAGSDRDRDALLTFSQRVQRMRETYTWHRHLKLLRHATIASEQAPVDLVNAREDPDACQAVVDWIHDKYDIDETPYTNQDYRVAVRIFGKRTLGHELAIEQREKEDITPSVMKREIKTTLPRSFKPRPDPASMMRSHARSSPQSHVNSQLTADSRCLDSVPPIFTTRSPKNSTRIPHD